MSVRVVPMLPCADIDDMADFFTAIGFTVALRQVRPNPYLALEGPGFPLHYYEMPGHRPEESHSTCGVVVPDTGPVFEAFAAGLRERYGRLPVSGFPRMTRPRPRKNAGGLTGFSLIDPAGNWIRFFRDPAAQPVAADLEEAEPSPLRESLLNAIVLADSKGDTAQAAKILRGALRRAAVDDPARADAAEFLTELDERLET